MQNGVLVHVAHLESAVGLLAELGEVGSDGFASLVGSQGGGYSSHSWPLSWGRGYNNSPGEGGCAGLLCFEASPRVGRVRTTYADMIAYPPTLIVFALLISG
ncbi:hypothetical protein BJD55_gp055 [Gordonia phage Yvonnetastic]|uniref:Uncharacterized protein n=1 Tax=Gordonia phage Yvonnetastic TaxID=1821566 RepID=A0A142K9C8_9CAUD|nr:hypothetical protein BJD55_gp055 [Gordonia phage Yvonnetastic]AMS02711.1 hypothetical protein SEA_YVONNETASTIC_167 [Gordonia phage Yvonnetastic]